MTENNISPIGGSWDEFKKTLLTAEEREEIETKTLLMSALIQARKDRGLTQKQLGLHTGVKQPFIARLENGMTDPQLSTLLKILNVLGKTIAIVDKPRNRVLTILLQCFYTGVFKFF